MTTSIQGGRPVTAVIVTYQSERTVDACIDAVKRGHDAGLLNCVFVDNGSIDRTATLLQRVQPWGEVVLTGINSGFGSGCNIGCRRVSSPFTIFINPDAIVEPEAIRTMLRFMEQNPDAGIVGPAILEGEPQGGYAMQAAGERLTPFTMVASAVPLLRRPPMSHPVVPGSPAVRAGWVCGAVLMIRTDLMTRLGGFDSRFFLYWEETDVCKRVEDLGYGIWAVGAAIAHHIGGASSSTDETRIDGCIANHYYQSRFYYMVKHHGWLSAAAAEAGELVLLALRSLYDVVRGRSAVKFRSRLQAPLFSQPDRL